MNIKVTCDSHYPSEFQITDRESLILSENSIERVINTAIEALEDSKHTDALTALGDLIELKSLMVRCWYSTQQAVFARKNGMRE